MARTIEVKILGDNKGLREALSDSDNRVRGWAANFGKIIAAGAAAGALAIGAGLAASVNQAVNLGESINAVEVTFGDAAAGIKQLGEEAATAVGLSNAEFNGLAVQFSSFARTVAGPGGDVVQTMDDLTTRASDFASVMNLDVSEAARVFQSGLAGETEPLKKFGIDLSAAAVEAYALANGIVAAGDEMTEAQKVQARYGLLMEQTAATQGDFANTSDSLANRQRVLMATVKNLAARIGSALLPTLAAVATVIATKLVPWLEQNLPKAIAVVQKIVGEIAAFVQEHWGAVVEAFHATVEVGREIVDFFATNQPALIGLIAALAAGFLAWAVSAAAAAVATIAAAAPIIAIIAVIGALVAALVYAYQNWEGFRLVVDAVVAWLRDVAWPAIQAFTQAIIDGFAALVEWVRTHWGEIKGTIENIIAAVRAIIETTIAAIQVAWEAWGDEILAYIEVTWETIRAVVQAAIDIVRGIIQTVAALIRGDWESAWDGIKDIVSAVWDAMVAIVTGALETLRVLLDAAASGIKLALSKPFTEAKELAGEAIDGIVSFVLNLPGRIYALIGGVASAGKSVGKAVLDGVIDGLTAAGGAIADLAGDIGSAVAQAVKTAANAVIDQLNSALEFTIPGPGPIPDIHLNPPDLPHFHTGGVVPGRRGTEVPIMALAGETVFTEDQMAALGSRGSMVGFQVNGDVRLDGVTTEQVAQRMMFALRAA